MTVNGFNSVSGSIQTMYGNTVQNTPENPTSNPMIMGFSSDVLELGAKSLFTGVSISRQIATSQRAIQNPDGSVAKLVHGNASMLKTGKNSAILSGLVSTGKNLYDYLQGNITGSRVGGNITSDEVGGIGSGMAAAGIGSLVAKMVGSSLGGGIIGLIAGTATFIGADLLYRNTGAYQTVSNKVTEFIDGLLNRTDPSGGW